MNITIHRGTHEIGGSCVELQTQKTKLLLEFGLPLSDEYSHRTCNRKLTDELIKEKITPEIEDLNEEKRFDAVLLSHAHQDHYGLLPFIHPDTPIYMSRGTKKLIDISYTFNQTSYCPKKIKVVEAWQSFTVKDVKIIPYLVDHSGFDAMSYLIETEGKKIFYTGDFRGHGRKGILFEKLVQNSIKDVHYLIMEGTMLSREDEEYRTEHDIEKELIKFLRKNGNLAFFSCSSQNIDRLVSAYRACLQTKTLLVLDPYTAYILYQLKDISKGLPQYDWEGNLRIFFIPNKYTGKVINDKKMYQFKKARITKEEIFSLKQKMLIKDSYLMRKIFQNKGLLKGTTIIFSQWEGYLENVKEFWDRNGVRIIKMHVSGHAYVEDLKRFVKALNPKNVIPIHTEKPERFADIFDSNIILLEDGEKFEIE